MELNFSPKPPMSTIAVRIPSDIRDMAKALALHHHVREGEIYRQILVKFFSTYREENLHGNGKTISTQQPVTIKNET